MGLLALLFLVVPFAELAVIIAVAGNIGIGNTIVALVVISVIGAWLAKREGLGVLRRLQDTVQAGGMPTTELVDGALILFAGALMLTPGFLSDVFAVLLLLPPTRAIFRGGLVRAVRRRTVLISRVTAPFPRGPGGPIDADSWEDRPFDDPPARWPEIDRP